MVSTVFPSSRSSCVAGLSDLLGKGKHGTTVVTQPTGAALGLNWVEWRLVTGVSGRNDSRTVQLTEDMEEEAKDRLERNHVVRLKPRRSVHQKS